MARILISCFSPVVDHGVPKLTCMYDGFVKALRDEGHEIRLIVTPGFLPRPWNGSNDLSPALDGEKLQADITTFAPQLTFAFNHSIPTPVLAALKCPIVLWDSDSIQFYNDKATIKANIDRYHFFCFSRHGVENAVQFGAPRDRVYFVPSATAVEAEPVVQTNAISFIGTMFRNNSTVQHFIEHYDNRAERDQIIALVKNGYAAIHDPYIVERLSKIEAYTELSTLFSMYAPTKRLSVLEAVASEGLVLYGSDEWTESSAFFPDLALAYKRKNVYSLQHNQDLYNASKLCLNICHSQVVDGYAWRVLDIMASNGCLFTDRTQGITDLLKGYVDLPMYETPSEAHELAKRLLRDHALRHDIVIASQQCIKDKGRWKHRFKQIEGILGLPLLAVSTLITEPVTLDPKHYQLSTARMVGRLGHTANKRVALRILLTHFSFSRRLVSTKLVQKLIKKLRTHGNRAFSQ